jgi:hypothetical protein
MSERTFSNHELDPFREILPAIGNVDQLSEDRCAKLVTALENCERQLKHVRLELTELKRVGPREGFKRLKDNRIAIEREIERIDSLISICTASWSGFHSKNEIFQDHGKRSESSLVGETRTFGAKLEA